MFFEQTVGKVGNIPGQPSDFGVSLFDFLVFRASFSFLVRGFYLFPLSVVWVFILLLTCFCWMEGYKTPNAIDTINTFFEAF